MWKTNHKGFRFEIYRLCTLLCWFSRKIWHAKFGVLPSILEGWIWIYKAYSDIWYYILFIRHIDILYMKMYTSNIYTLDMYQYMILYVFYMKLYMMYTTLFMFYVVYPFYKKGHISYIWKWYILSIILLRSHIF